MDDVKTLSKLFKQGANPNEGDIARGETALMWCVREDSLRAFDWLLSQPQVDMNARANNGDTALMLASYLEKIELVDQLISAGAKVNQEGWSALHYAAVVGNIDIVRLLLRHGAVVNALSPNKTTALMMATRSGRLTVVKLLIENGANITLKNEQGMSAYDFAVQAEMRHIAQYLNEVTH